MGGLGLACMMHDFLFCARSLTSSDSDIQLQCFLGCLLAFASYSSHHFTASYLPSSHVSVMKGVSMQMQALGLGPVILPSEKYWRPTTNEDWDGIVENARVQILPVPSLSLSLSLCPWRTKEEGGMTQQREIARTLQVPTATMVALHLYSHVPFPLPFSLRKR